MNAAWYAQKASPGFSEEMHCFAVFMDIAPLAAQSMANVVFLKYESGRLVHPHIFRVDWARSCVGPMEGERALSFGR